MKPKLLFQILLGAVLLLELAALATSPDLLIAIPLVLQLVLAGAATRWPKDILFDTAFLLAIMIAAAHVMLTNSAWLAMFLVPLSLAAWDLCRFQRVLTTLIPQTDLPTVQRTHLRRLGISAAGGFAIALLAQLFTLKLSFPVLAGAALLLALSFAAFASRLIRNG